MDSDGPCQTQWILRITTQFILFYLIVLLVNGIPDIGPSFIAYFNFIFIVFTVDKNLILFYATHLSYFTVEVSSWKMFIIADKHHFGMLFQFQYRFIGIITFGKLSFNYGFKTIGFTFNLRHFFGIDTISFGIMSS